MIRLFTICFLISVVFGCKKTRRSLHGIPNSIDSLRRIKTNLPINIKKIKNLTIHSVQQQPTDTIILQKQHIFRSNKNVYFNGYIGPVAVDNQNRVYIGVGKAQAFQSIYIFKPNGSFITKIGHVGKGPGEFLSISSLEIRNHRLYVYDPRLNRITLFSLRNYHRINDSIIRDTLKFKGSDISLNNSHLVHITNNGNILMGFIERNSRFKKGKKLMGKYYYVDENGNVLPNMVLEIEQPSVYNSSKKPGPGVALPFTMPYTRSMAMAFTEQDQIYTAWTNDFLIKVYDGKGDYKRAIYYPIEKAPLETPTLNANDAQKKVLNTYKLPKTWPAIHRIFFDDQNRLWVFTIINSDTSYKGWVLSKNGKLLARFNWPSRRASRFVGRSNGEIKPLILVKDGYLYKAVINFKKNLNQVVKYKIQFKKNK